MGIFVGFGGSLMVGFFGIMVLAYPGTVDVSTVACTRKSRVYTTGKQDIGTVIIRTASPGRTVVRW